MVTPSTSVVTYNVEFTRVIDRKLKIGLADGVMLADGKEIYKVSDMRVGLFRE